MKQDGILEGRCKGDPDLGIFCIEISLQQKSSVCCCDRDIRPSSFVAGIHLASKQKCSSEINIYIQVEFLYFFRRMTPHCILVRPQRKFKCCQGLFAYLLTSSGKAASLFLKTCEHDSIVQPSVRDLS